MKQYVPWQTLWPALLPPNLSQTQSDEYTIEYIHHKLPLTLTTQLLTAAEYSGATAQDQQTAQERTLAF